MESLIKQWIDEDETIWEDTEYVISELIRILDTLETNYKDLQEVQENPSDPNWDWEEIEYAKIDTEDLEGDLEDYKVKFLSYYPNANWEKEINLLKELYEK